MIEGDRLTQLGWDSSWAESLEQLGETELTPARVVGQRKGSYRLWDAHRELTAVASGKLRRDGLKKDVYPAVGDWVAVRSTGGDGEVVIRAVLPRKTKFSRQAAGGRMEEQVVAANVDTAFIVAGLDGGRNLSPRRIERYLALAWSSGVAPVVVLNKMDVCDEVAAAVSEVEAIAVGAPIHAVSATERLGLEDLGQYLASGLTAAFLGSSGVGKSSIINALLGVETLKVGAVRDADLRGRHTTSHRELLLLPDGGAVIDTPGMRDLQMWGDGDDDGGLGSTFRDVEELAEGCRFGDCTHRTEPGCAVTAAIAGGDLDEARLRDYRRLQKELDNLARRQDHKARLEAKAKGKRMAQMQKEAQRDRRERQ